MQLRNNTAKLPKDGSNLLQYFEQHRRASVKNLNRSESREVQVEIQSGSCGSRFCCSEAEMDRICWAEPSQEYLPFAFCRDTSLHGLKVSRSRSNIFQCTYARQIRRIIANCNCKRSSLFIIYNLTMYITQLIFFSTLANPNDILWKGT